jgi:hypothetical protein
VKNAPTNRQAETARDRGACHFPTRTALRIERTSRHQKAFPKRMRKPFADRIVSQT